MTVIDVVPDKQARSLTLTAEFDAPIASVWQMWADPRQLEKWWGPPTYPATVEEHNLVSGGQVTYFMTGPDDEKFAGWWSVSAVQDELGLTFEDSFGTPDGPPSDMPVTRTNAALEDLDTGGTRMTITSLFPSSEAMDQLTAMGMVEGLTEAVGQIDKLLENFGQPAA